MTGELRFRGDDDHIRFRKWLANRKQVGSNILITGEVPDAVSALASRNFFGRARRRFRVLGLTDKTITNANARLPEDASFDDASSWIIDQRRGERSVPATAPSFVPAQNSLQTDDAEQLCDEVQAAISFYDDEADGLDPAELRLGIDSLFPIVQRDQSAARRVLQTLGETVHDVHGMAHYHLRVPASNETVEDLMDLFDARIELRKRPRQKPEQRWYAPKIDEKTPWMEL